MSIRQTQTKNVFDFVAKSYFIDGQNPLLSDIYKYISKFFSQQPAGVPFRVPLDSFAGDSISNPELINDFMAMVVTNIDTLYETCFDQIDQVFMLNTILSDHLERLRIKRSILNSRIDDYLLGIFNSDGYFYSFSDDFSSSFYTDFNYTDAYLDTAAGTVSIPSIGSMSKTVNSSIISNAGVYVLDLDGAALSIDEKSPFDNAIDGLSNTAWYFETKTNNPGPITAEIDISLATAYGENKVSKVELIPFGVEPIRVGIEGRFLREDDTVYSMPFSKDIKTSANKMVFVSDNPNDSLVGLNLQVSKAKADYQINDSQNRSDVYMFGFKDIFITEQYYDPTARFVSEAFGMPSDLGREAVIDSVSLVVADSKPTGTSIEYYIAQDVPTANSLNDFDWKRIEPLTDSKIASSQVIRFNGSRPANQMIRITPRDPSDVKLFDLNSTNIDLSRRNPTPSYFDGIDVYRVCSFDDDFLSNTIKLEEGINTTRIYYTDLDPLAYSNDFDFWKLKFEDPASYSTTYGQIDSGHEFLYGADIGENRVSVYSETFVYIEEEMPVILKECRKSDSNSKTWAIKVFLNGREIAAMPVGVDRLTVPWKFKQGKNHVVVMANIPPISTGLSAPYIGTFNIMANSDLSDFGTVKLDDLSYVDPYRFENNLTNQSKSFTIFNNEIITRTKPTNNFKLSYNQATDNSPNKIRLRAELKRFSNYSSSTPMIDSYRLRFSYGN